jgi:hypothetical protein
LRFVVDGHERWMGLGADSVIGAKGATERARAARLKLMEGNESNRCASHRTRNGPRRGSNRRDIPCGGDQVSSHHSGRWSTPKTHAQWMSHPATIPSFSRDASASTKACAWRECRRDDRRTPSCRHPRPVLG